MSLIGFTQNYHDLSTDRGYQFKFFCDKCGNGFMTTFRASALGVAGGVLDAASHLFGGFFGNASAGAYDVQRAVGGKAHDDALREAVAEAKAHFKQCSRCGKWVCPENCWNASRSLCEACAPDLAEEMAAAQAQATKDQIWQKAAQTNYVGGINMDAPATAFCPQCGAKTTGGAFCAGCGFKLFAKSACPQCAKPIEAGARFCPGCGGKLA